MAHGILGESMRGNVTVGRFSYGLDSRGVYNWGSGAVLNIGQFCSIARGVSFFLGGDHRMDWCTTFPFGTIFTEDFGSTRYEGHPKTNGDINIGNDVWIGTRATVMSGVTIGDGSVIAANSHVVKDVEEYSFVGGNPAVFVGKRFGEDVIDILRKLKWWDLDVSVIRTIIPSLCHTPNVNILTSFMDKYRS